MAESVMNYFRRSANAATLTFPLITAGGSAFINTGAIGAGDVKVSIDGAAFNNTTNLPAQIGTTGIYTLTLTAAEMTGTVIAVTIKDAAVNDLLLLVETELKVSANNILEVAQPAEPTTAPSSTDSYAKILQHLSRRFFNKVTQTSTVQTQYKDDSATALWTATCADDGTTQTKGKSA